MKLVAFLLATLALFSGVIAVDLKKEVLITYPDDTADSVVEEAKQVISDAGGIITHEFNLIKGFSATVGEKILDTVRGLGSQSLARIEESKKVSAY